MRATQHHFLPDRLRPRAPRRRSRRRTFLPAITVMGVLLALPLWTVGSVEIRGGEVVPAPVTESLEGMVGHMIPTLDLEWLRRVAATWPAAAEVRVHLDLPGKLVVEIYPETARGSVEVGSRWHAVAADGRLAGGIDEPVTPLLVGFSRPADRRSAFGVVRRLAEASGGEILAVRRVTPGDYRVEMRFGGSDRTTTVHVTPDGTEAEKAWSELVRSGATQVEWADVRWAHRLVVREAA